MSVWAEIRKKSLGEEQRAEDTPQHVVTITLEEKIEHGIGLISMMFYQLKYLGRVDGHHRNKFYPKGLGELYQVQEACSLYGVSLDVGDMIISYDDDHCDTNYYVYDRQKSIIR